MACADSRRFPGGGVGRSRLRRTGARRPLPAGRGPLPLRRVACRDASHSGRSDRLRRRRPAPGGDGGGQAGPRRVGVAVQPVPLGRSCGPRRVLRRRGRGGRRDLRHRRCRRHRRSGDVGFGKAGVSGPAAGAAAGRLSAPVDAQGGGAEGGGWAIFAPSRSAWPLSARRARRSTGGSGICATSSWRRGRRDASRRTSRWRWSASGPAPSEPDEPAPVRRRGRRRTRPCPWRPEPRPSPWRVRPRRRRASCRRRSRAGCRRS